jgi:hypothetical protein
VTRTPQAAQGLVRSSLNKRTRTEVRRCEPLRCAPFRTPWQRFSRCVRGPRGIAHNPGNAVKPGSNRPFGDIEHPRRQLPPHHRPVGCVNTISLQTGRSRPRTTLRTPHPLPGDLHRQPAAYRVTSLKRPSRLVEEAAELLVVDRAAVDPEAVDARLVSRLVFPNSCCRSRWATFRPGPAAGREEGTPKGTIPAQA